jgi:hypothetical protein
LSLSAGERDGPFLSRCTALLLCPSQLPWLLVRQTVNTSKGLTEKIPLISYFLDYLLSECVCRRVSI